MVNRRNFLAWTIHSVGALVSAALGVVLGGAALFPSRTKAAEAGWMEAGSPTSLSTDRPTEVALRVERNDGYYTTTDRHIVYLVKDDHGVRAFSSVCTHLGCRVAWNAQEKLFKCPCHGGSYTLTGAVVGGPPPRGLDEVAVRVEGDRVEVRMT